MHPRNGSKIGAFRFFKRVRLNSEVVPKRKLKSYELKSFLVVLFFNSGNMILTKFANKR